MGKHSFRNQLIGLTAVIASCLLVGNVLVWQSSDRLQNAEGEKKRLVEAVLCFKDLRYRIVNIQQYIQDATTIGADDYSEALEQKQAAKLELEKLVSILPESKNEAVKVGHMIDQVYATGETMANAYFTQGRFAGNQLMKEGDDSFDARVEQLTAHLDQSGEALVQRMNQASELQAMQSAQMLRMSTGIGGLALLMLFAANFWLGRKVFAAVGGEPDLAADVAKRIAAGDLSMQIALKTGDRSSVLAEMQNMVMAIRALVADAVMLADAAVDGRLATRADVSRHQGEFRLVVEGVNATLDAVIGPLHVAADYVEKIAQGKLPDKISAHYAGDFDHLKANLNTCIDAIEALISDVAQLAKAAQDGCLNVRADAGRHKGDYCEIIEGINAMLDGVILPINEVVAVLGKVELGDLTQTVNGDYRGQLQALKTSVNSTIATLAQTIVSVVNSSHQIGEASQQINITSNMLSQSACQQASSVEETLANIEQMVAGIEQNADNAKVTDSMASKSAQDSQSGSAAVRKTLEAMQEIAQRVGIIDDIAYQTNMLALNAAIEAARVGELGKGFAVVADEVRKLAERSQAAAQEIGELAVTSVNTAEGAGKMLDAIVPNIAKTSDLVQEIAASSQEQSVAVGQINSAMAQVNQITQQNASASEELAATAVHMTSQAEQLKQLMGFFKVEGHGLAMVQGDQVLNQMAY